MQNKSEEKEFFDRFAESQQYDVLTSFGYNSIISGFRKFIKNRIPKEFKAIDLGCGTGAFTRQFSHTGDMKLFGLDISLNAIRLANQKMDKNRRIRYLAGDMENICFKDESFDLIIYSGVLHHFFSIERSLSEGYRVLKKGGYILTYDPNIKNPFFWLYRNPSSLFYSQNGKTGNERLLSREEIVNMMKQVGFRHINNHCLSGVTFKYVASDT